MRRARWVVVAAAGVVLVAAGVLLWRSGLERSDQWASVLSFFVGALSLLVGLVQTLRPVRRRETTSPTIVGDHNQIVTGRAKIVTKNRYSAKRFR